ncbi:MAG: tetratricopeptide repeat protein [Clostridia bacterium]|jgi:tetratricopeptide (TPR) repeat protein|nr:tetratricopeptide repeat protein [Clostridia bacterium]
MAYACPYCGEQVDDENRCMICKRDLEWVAKIYAKSNSYYVKGYYEAKSKNLSSASTYLEKAIYFNKYNITARNLLGLIYFEMGKIGSALKEWIISASLSKEENIAEEYIQRIQNSPKMLVTYKDSIALYNKALMYLKQKNNDMAIIRLKKAVSLNPNLIEARNLLALCHIKEKKFYKANEQLKSVLSIDHSNLKALAYFKELSHEDTDKVQPYELEYIPRQSKNNYVKPSRIINRGHMLAGYVIYFVIGVLCMLVVQTSLILPNKTKNYERQIVELKDSEIKMSSLLEEERRQSQAEIKKLEEQNQKLVQEKQGNELALSKMAQKEKIAQITNLKNKKEWVQAAEILYNVAPSLLDDDTTALYNKLKNEVYPKASAILCDEGYKQLNKGEYVEAKSKLEKSILYGPSATILRRSLYYLGRVEKEQGNIEQAKYYFNTVTEQHKGTNEAYWSAGELEKLK